LAIVTAAQARAYIPSQSGTGLDTSTFEPLVEAADQALAAYCRFPLTASGTERTLATGSYTLYIDGPGGEVLRLPIRPVTAVASIYDDPDRVYGADTLVASGDYDLIQEDGVVLLKTTATHGRWTSGGRRAVKVACTAGFAVGASAPDFIRHAVALLVAHWWRKEIPSIGAKAGDAREVVDRLVALELPIEVRRAIAPAVLFGGVAR
jgi:hypothetical protein